MRKLKVLGYNLVSELAYQLGSSEEELAKLTSNVQRYYYTKKRIKPNGKIRITNTPTGRLKEITKQLNVLLQRLEFPSYVHCAIRGKSNITNALEHTQQDYIVQYDLKDFFPNISENQVLKMFRERLACRPTVAKVLVALTTYQGQVPQGSPTSTIVATLVLLPVLERLNKLALQHNAKFSQLVDDLTFSGPQHLSKLKGLVFRIIESSGFIVNPVKFDSVPRYRPQVVTGVRVNDGIDAPPKLIQEIKRVFLSASQGELSFDQPTYLKIQGKISYLKQLNPGAAKHYQKKLDKYKPDIERQAGPG